MVSSGSPLVSSTRTSAAPGTAPATLAMRLPTPSSVSRSSPNSITATSARTPEISSLVRIWIGWVNS